MRFSELIANLDSVKVVNATDADVTAIAYDSRDVRPGSLFIARVGGAFDGHNYIPAALDAGATAIVAEREVDDIPATVSFAVAPDGRVAMGNIAASLYGYPSRSLKLIGVTGTSGKTTVTHLIQAIFNASGNPAGLIGTIGAKVGDELIETKHTTPESADIQRILAEMRDRGATVVAMEASSHGLVQGRTIGCEFDCGVFTNIARDHLDFHGTVEAYLDAKLTLFRDYPARSDKKFHAIVNADDSSCDEVIAVTRGQVTTFGVENPASVRAAGIEVTSSSVSFELNYQGSRIPIRLNIGGFFNVYNALASASAALALGLDLETIALGLAAARCVPGRFESVNCGQEFGVIVDYAHTPDELENVLRTARDLTERRLIVVFGCGGDRDRGKRPIMGEIGARLADVVVITSDNPRSEDPGAIINEILVGVPENAVGRVLVEVDRAAAIRLALGTAVKGDLVVIAGKGHEDYQIFADRTIHFDDREVARGILAELVA
jgi:UDP-N-acetylmuramoyl-L-alanyl-D-glutamate--2,6-diaminopimelate ligase